MKKFSTLLKPALIVAALILAVSARAQNAVSIDFGSSIASGAAGVVPEGYWNAAPLTGTPGSNAGTAVTNSNSGSLLDSTGATSSVGYSIVSYGNKNAGESMSTANSTNDSTLMSNGAATRGVGSSGASAPNPVGLTLSGLNSSTTYNIIVYLGTQGLLLGKYSVGLSNGSTFFGETSYGGNNAVTLNTFENNSSATDFGAITATNAPTYQSNYVEFTGYTGYSTATLTLTMLGNWNGTYNAAGGGTTGCTVDISGVEILPIPEPSTYAMILGGVGLLLARQRIRLNSRRS